MPGARGWSQGTCCLYWSEHSWCWALAPAGRPSALIAPDRSVSMQPHHSGCFQGSWHGRTILFVEDQPLLGRHLHRRELSTGLFGGRLQTMSPDTKNATSTNYRFRSMKREAIVSNHQHVQVLAMCAFDRESTCQLITCSGEIAATGQCRVGTSAFRARACPAGGHEHGQNEPRKLDMRTVRPKQVPSAETMDDPREYPQRSLSPFPNED